MKIGVCGGIERAPIIKSLGFDYIEENMDKTVKLSDGEVEERIRTYDKLELPVYSFNCFFGKEITIYGENSLKEVEEYASKALLRANKFGASICVIGSGAARNIPNGISREFAEKRFCDAVSICADIANTYGIKIAIEPLNRNETNYINTVKEASYVAKNCGKENAGALIDFFHFFMENENEEEIVKNIDSIIHAHIARPNADRTVPKVEDRSTVSRWAKCLKDTGYNGAVSIEAKYVDFESELTETVKLIELFR